MGRLALWQAFGFSCAWTRIFGVFGGMGGVGFCVVVFLGVWGFVFVGWVPWFFFEYGFLCVCGLGYVVSWGWLCVAWLRGFWGVLRFCVAGLWGVELGVDVAAWLGLLG